MSRQTLKQLYHYAQRYKVNTYAQNKLKDKIHHKRNKLFFKKQMEILQLKM